MSMIVEEDPTEALKGSDEEGIQIIVEIFLTCWATLCYTLRAKRSSTIDALKTKITADLGRLQHRDSFVNYDVEEDAFFFGKQFLQDASTLAECNISNMSRISVLPCNTFEIEVAARKNPEAWVGIEYFKVNSLDLVSSLKNKIFEETGIPSHKQVLCCGDRWLSPSEDEIPLRDLGIVQQIGRDQKIMDMPLLQLTAYRPLRLSNQNFEIMVRVPHNEVQFSLLVNSTNTISHLKAMILQNFSFLDETYMLIFGDKNLLEDGNSVLLDHIIEKGAQLVLCQKGSFLIWVSEKGTEQLFTIEVESMDTIHLIKRKIQNITGISPEDQVLFNENCEGRDYMKVMYKGTLVSHGIVKLSDPKVPQFRISYSVNDRLKLYVTRKLKSEVASFPNFPFSFWQKLSDCASARVLLEDFLLQVNSQSKVEASFKIYVLVPFRECLALRIMFTMRASETVESLRTKIQEEGKFEKAIDDLSYIEQGDYILLLNKQKLLVDGSSTMEKCGIQDEVEILLCPKVSFSVKVCISSSRNGLNKIEKNVIVNCLDTIDCVKKKIVPHSRSNIESMQLWYNDIPLSDEMLLVDYGIVSYHVKSRGRRWTACQLKLKAIMVEGRDNWHYKRSGSFLPLNPKTMIKHRALEAFREHM